MKIKTTLGFVLIFSAASAAHAQTKISGAVQCSKPDPEQKIAVGDTPGHIFLINQFKCTWTKPMEIEGVPDTDGIGTSFAEVTGNASHFHGYFIDTMKNGDKAHYRYEGTGSIKDSIQTDEDKWWLVRGTGKLKGFKGHGTCKGKTNQEGGETWECEGEYTLPKVGAKKRAA